MLTCRLVGLVETAAVVVGDTARAREIVHLDPAVADGHPSPLAFALVTNG